MRTFEELLTNLQHANVRLMVAGSTEAVRDVLERFRVADRIGAANFFPTVHAAVEAALAERERQQKALKEGVEAPAAGAAAATVAVTVDAEAREEGSQELRQRRGHWWDRLLTSDKAKETYVELGDI